MINWNKGTKKEYQLCNKIARRLFIEYTTTDIMSVSMDIMAVHTSGCPLKLQELLDADNFNFLHDVFGICRNIDRDTGKLQNFFLPRYAE